LSTIAVHVEDAVARITLDRPDKRNAINDEMRTELTAAFAAFDADPSVRVVVLTGSGSAFCAGGDLSASAAPDPQRPRIVEPLDQFSKPVIAAINGLAFGGGLELALACDLRIAQRDAQLGFPEVNLGLLPGGGGTQRAPRLIGPGRAAWLVMSGERIRAEQAERWGLVEVVVDDLDTGIEQVAGKLAQQSPHALREIKQLLHTTRDQRSYELESQAFARCLVSEDGQEGVAAFLEKREPRWTGR
jgi:enoyl-CoA hydratase/carnithine racemase